MVDRLHDEAGTTLTELLVVMVILGVIGSITTVGIVTGFRAQTDSTNVAETLDGMRIATQRVRDVVRGATEVCADSGEQFLRLWTDRSNDGIVDDDEIDIFELIPVNAAGDVVFQRRTLSGVVQLIRDDIIEDTVFEYDAPPANQPFDLRCGTPGTGSAPVRRVDVLFGVAHPDPAELPLETSTAVRLRNANLAEPSRNRPPSASFTVSCPKPDLTCEFDGSDSSDPEDGTVSFYSWEVKDPDTGTVVHTAAGNNLATFDHTFVAGTGDQDYTVLLTVTDSDGAPDSTDGIAHPVEDESNPPPDVRFTISCKALICEFDATESSDIASDGEPGEIASYAWHFGENNSDGPDVVKGKEEPTHTHSFAEEGTYTVRLTVTDSEGASTTRFKTISVGTDVFFVSKMSGVKSGSGNNRVATVSTQLELTAGGNPGKGLSITISAKDSSGVPLTERSCTTNTAGSCAVSFVGLNNSRFPITATVQDVEETGKFVYDPSQNTVTEVTFS